MLSALNTVELSSHQIWELWEDGHHRNKTESSISSQTWSLTTFMQQLRQKSWRCCWSSRAPTFGVLRTNWCFPSSPSWAFSCSSLATSSSICTKTRRWSKDPLAASVRRYRMLRPTWAAVIPDAECKRRARVAVREAPSTRHARTQVRASMVV